MTSAAGNKVLGNRGARIVGWVFGVVVEQIVDFRYRRLRG